MALLQYRKIFFAVLLFCLIYLLKYDLKSACETCVHPPSKKPTKAYEWHRLAD